MDGWMNGWMDGLMDGWMMYNDSLVLPSWTLNFAVFALTV